VKRENNIKRRLLAFPFKWVQKMEDRRELRRLRNMGEKPVTRAKTNDNSKKTNKVGEK